ncbi:MAG: hypothetical protein JXM73_13855 [Anaerolineae bacterium]|nr:hypothetical protein [Anaerolineae bacterium]
MTADQTPNSQLFNNIPWPKPVAWKGGPLRQPCSNNPLPQPVELRYGLWNLKDGTSRDYFHDNLPPDWEPWLTRQDTWYFGVWINQRTFEIIICYRRELIYMRYAGREDLGRQLQAMSKVHGPPPVDSTWISEDGTIVEYYLERADK